MLYKNIRKSNRYLGTPFYTFLHLFTPFYTSNVDYLYKLLIITDYNFLIFFKIYYIT
jgi:hypothetical protein